MSRQAHPVTVPVHKPLIRDDRYDYADAFEVPVSEVDRRSAEEITRSAPEGAGPLVRWAISDRVAVRWPTHVRS